MNLNLVQKNLLLNLILVILTAGTIIFVLYSEGTQHLVSHALEDLSSEVGQEEIRIANHVESLKADVRFLSGTPPIQGIFRALEQHGIDASDGSTELQWKQRLASIFSTLLSSKNGYLQARLLDNLGQEIVRVERINNKIAIVTDSELQNKRDRDYVQETLDLENKNVYLSDITLNREKGKVVTPHVVAIRAATPIYNKENRLLGLIVVNLDIGQELDRIEKLFSQQKQLKLYITNHTGSYIVHPQKEKRFSFDLGYRYRIQEEYPLLSSLYFPGNNDTKRVLVPENNSDDVVVSSKLHLNKPLSDRYIVISLAQPYANIVAAQQKIVESTRQPLIILVIIFVITGYFASRLTSRPLQEITQAISKITSQSHDVNLPLDRKDEIGLLARTFSDMMKKVNRTQQDLKLANENLEQKVEERTHELGISEAKQRSVLETIVDGIITISESGKVLTFNPAAEKIFGFSSSEMIGQNVKTLMPDPYFHQHDDYLKKYKATKQASIIGIGREVEGKRKDGSIFPLDLAISATIVGNETRYTGVVRDITERKRIATMKNEFISTVSHELRTPLTSIRGAIGLVSGGAIGKLPPEAENMLKIASNNTERLLLLINDILDIQKIESGKMEFNFDSVQLKPFLHQAVNENQTYADQYDVSFAIKDSSDDIAVYADKDRLMQVMNNLMSNAAKFSPRNEIVEIKLEQRGEIVRISVSDHGPGIPKEFHEKLFEKFTQSDASDTRQKGGTGLGLNIARSIVDKHGGYIDFISNKGKGTSFFIELPILSGQSTENYPVQSNTL